MKGRCKMKRVILTICLLLVGGCVEPVQLVQRIPFPVEEYRKLPKMGTGTATIQGQAFLKTRGGDVKYAAGNEIYLLPVTSYSNQWYRVSLEWPKKAINPIYDPRYKQYITTVIGDGEGRFEFKNVPAGDYYLSTTIVWQYVEGGRYPSLTPTGGTIVKKISVKDNQKLKVIFTR